jgi:hypothetical protein
MMQNLFQENLDEAPTFIYKQLQKKSVDTHVAKTMQIQSFASQD